MVLGLEKRVKVLGVPLDNIPSDDFEPVIMKLVGNIGVNRIVILDFRGFMRERKRLKKESFVNDAAVVITTSRAVAWAARYLHGVDSVRFYPFSFVINTLSILERKFFSVYLLGGSSKDIQKVFGNIRASFPEIKIVGRYKAFCSPADEKSVLIGMKKAGADFTFVGTNIKKGDKWIASSSKDLAPGIHLWAPSVFKIMSGTGRPVSDEKWVRRFNIPVKTFFLPWRWFVGFRYLFFFIKVLVEKKQVKKEF